MWVFLNNAFFSIVQDRKDPEVVVIRARIKGDLEKAFGVSPESVKETDDSDYRFRIFATKADVAHAMHQHVLNIDYTNFKDSIHPKDKNRKKHYSEVWAVMFRWQDRLYPSNWWVNYRNHKK